VWRVVLQVQEERLGAFACNELHSAFTEQICEVPFDTNLLRAIVEVLLECLRVHVTGVVSGGAGKAKELVEAVLQRVVLGQQSEMPFADECGFVAGILHEAAQGCRLRSESGRIGRERLEQTCGVACRVPPGHERHAGGCANRRG
jgi:hypothetical protein